MNPPRTDLGGADVAVLGLGRSGISVARALIAQGARPHVFDQGLRKTLNKPELADAAEAEGIPIEFGWEGDLPPQFGILVTNPAVDHRSPVLQSLAARGVRVISEIEFAFHISKAPIIAITGTNGKSTTTVMTYLALQACGVDAVLCGNIFGSGYPEQSLTEAAMASTPDQVLVAEISSFQLEWVNDFRPIAAGITNIWPDHLDRYDSFADYAATKQRIFAQMEVGDFAVIKANDPLVVPPGPNSPAHATPGSYLKRRDRRAAAAGQTSGPTVLTFGATGEHARVEDTELILLDKRLPLLDLPFQEPHNRLNASMAALLAFGALNVLAERDPAGPAAAVMTRATDEARTAWQAGRSVYSSRAETAPEYVCPPEIIEGLKRFKGLAHRMEFLGERNGVRVINNSMCTNPDAVVKSIQAVEDPVHVLIGGVNKGLDFAPLRHYFANGRNHFYLFGRDAAKIGEVLRPSGPSPTFTTMAEAFDAATASAVKGQVIMLAPGCASSDQFRDFRDRGDVFRSIAQRWLNPQSWPN